MLVFVQVYISYWSKWQQQLISPQRRKVREEDLSFIFAAETAANINPHALWAIPSIPFIPEIIDK